MPQMSSDKNRRTRSMTAALFRYLCGKLGLELVDGLDSPAWRYAFVDQPPIPSGVDAVLLDSLTRIRAAGKKQVRFALITAVAPAETGIAHASIQTFRNFNGGVDVFSRLEDPGAYAHFASEAVISELGLEIFDVASMTLAQKMRGYEAIVVAIGNSKHNRFVAAQLTLLAKLGASAPVFVHVHDPWLHDIWVWSAAAANRSAATDLATVYGGPMRTNFHRSIAFDLGALGLAAILREAPIAGIIVNSAAAEKLVLHDLDRAGRKIPVIRAFHPVFEPIVARPLRPSQPRPLLVGSFGVPGKAKRTHIVYEAVKKLIERGIDTQLILAGYNVAQYLNRHRRFDRSIIRAFDSPNDTSLQELMATADVAVQLRREGLGESSGVVPQLLALGRPVIASAVGSFVEYGDAVVKVDQTADANAIANAIIAAHEKRHQLEAEAAKYCSQRTPAAFMQLLEKAVGTHVVAKKLAPSKESASRKTE